MNTPKMNHSIFKELKTYLVNNDARGITLLLGK